MNNSNNNTMAGMMEKPPIKLAAMATNTTPANITPNKRKANESIFAISEIN